MADLNISLPLPAFFNSDGGNIRVHVADDRPWFCLVDVCTTLGIENQRNVASRLRDSDKNTVRLADGIRGNPYATFISESAFYKVVLRSDKPKAEPFADWVAGEVIPCIRKHGCYPAPALVPADPDAADPIISEMSALRKVLDSHIELRRCQLATDRELAAVRTELGATKTTATEAKTLAEAADNRAQAAASMASAALQTFESGLGYFTLVGYGNITGRCFDVTTAARHGRNLAALCRNRGLAVGRSPDVRYGTVNAYPESVLIEYFGDTARCGHN